MDKRRIVFKKYKTILLNVHFTISQKMRGNKTERVILNKGFLLPYKKKDGTTSKTASLEECREET